MDLRKLIDAVSQWDEILGQALHDSLRGDKLYIFKRFNTHIYVHKEGWIMELKGRWLEIRYNAIANEIQVIHTTDPKGSVTESLGTEVPVIHIGENIDDSYLTLSNTSQSYKAPITNYNEFLSKFTLSLMSGKDEIVLSDVEVETFQDYRFPGRNSPDSGFTVKVYKPSFDLEIWVGYKKRPVLVYFTNTVKPQVFPIGTRPYEYEYYPILDIAGNELVIRFMRAIAGSRYSVPTYNEEMYSTLQDYYRKLSVNITSPSDFTNVVGSLLVTKGFAQVDKNVVRLDVLPSEAINTSTGWEVKLFGDKVVAVMNDSAAKTLTVSIGAEKNTFKYSSITPVMLVDYFGHIKVAAVRNVPSQLSTIPRSSVPGYLQYILFSGKGLFVTNDVKIYNREDVMIGNEYELRFRRNEDRGTDEIQLYRFDERLLTFILTDEKSDAGCDPEERECYVMYRPIFIFVGNKCVVKPRLYNT